MNEIKLIHSIFDRFEVVWHLIRFVSKEVPGVGQAKEDAPVVYHTTPIPHSSYSSCVDVAQGYMSKCVPHIVHADLYGRRL